MNVDIPITSSSEYFDREIDWEDNDKNLVPLKQAKALQKILTAEVSIYLLRRSTGFCGSLVDDMVETRRMFIDEYEKYYGPYTNNQNHY